MVEIKVCVGSSCFLKGSSRIVEFLKNKIEEEKLNDEVELKGSFCVGKCNRIGVTITVNDKVYTGITMETIKDFWKESVSPLINK